MTNTLARVMTSTPKRTNLMLAIFSIAEILCSFDLANVFGLSAHDFLEVTILDRVNLQWAGLKSWFLLIFKKSIFIDFLLIVFDFYRFQISSINFYCESLKCKRFLENYSLVRQMDANLNLQNAHLQLESSSISAGLFLVNFNSFDSRRLNNVAFLKCSSFLHDRLSFASLLIAYEYSPSAHEHLTLSWSIQMPR